MNQQSIVLIILFPFFAAFICSVIGLFRKNWCYFVAILGCALALFASVMTLVQLKEVSTLTYRLANWPPPIGIQFVVDPLNIFVLILISVVALITAIYSKESVTRELPGKENLFYTLFLLLTVGCLGMSITGDAFNLYVFLEISSLSSYALIAMGNQKRAALSCFNYIIMGTIGASFLLLGVGYLYIKTGSLNMADIHNILSEQQLYKSNTIKIGFLFILIGVWIKMAFFPLHRWLPNAYTFAPTATSCLIAPLMTKVSIYVMIRFMFTVFSPEFVFESAHRSNAVVWLSVAAILIGSFYAMSKRKMKKMLAYLVVAEVGYMVGAVWLADRMGLIGAIFHIISDGMMTLCLFLFAGIMYYKSGGYSINHISGKYATMPLSMAGFTVAAFSMIGIPPTCGFFSKWYLISGGINSGHWEYVIALLLSSLANAVIFFRIIEKGLHGDMKHNHEPKKIDEAPMTMVIPLLVTAVGLIVLGVFSSKVIDFISRFVAGTGLS